jgi:hypothetical protein
MPTGTLAQGTQKDVQKKKIEDNNNITHTHT